MPDTPPQILYKYMPTARIGFFDIPQLRFTPPAEFNDIFDCQIRTKGFVRPGVLVNMARRQPQIQFDKILDSELKKMKIPPALLTMLTPAKRAELKKQFEPIFEEFLEQMAPITATEESREKFSKAVQNALCRARVGILCLTPDKANTAMWGIYATDSNGQGNMGFAVGFNTSAAFFNRKLTPDDALRHLRPVSYPENPPNLFFSDYMEESIPEQSVLFDILYIKDKEWEAEKEWRMAITVPEDSASKVFGLENIPIDAIKEVLLGARADSVLENAASAFCKQHNIPFYRMKTTVDRILRPEPIILSK